MQCVHSAHEHIHSSSRGCRHSVDFHRQTVTHAPNRALVRRKACSAAGDATVSSTASVLPAQQQQQNSQRNIRQSPCTGVQSCYGAQRQTTNNSRGASQKHASKHTASNSGSTRRSLQQLLAERAAYERPPLLTAAVKACSSWQQAALLFADHSHEFNHVHTAALISHLPKVCAAAAWASAGGVCCAGCHARKTGSTGSEAAAQCVSKRLDVKACSSVCCCFCSINLEPQCIVCQQALCRPAVFTAAASPAAAAAARCSLVSRRR
jgi:hypothetical protein